MPLLHPYASEGPFGNVPVPTRSSVRNLFQASDYRIQSFRVRLDCREPARSLWFDRRAAQKTECNDPEVREE
jgi:hypothetical protein